MSTNEAFALRPVVPEDWDFLLRVYESSRAIELAMVPWSAEQKRAFVRHQLEAQTTYYATEYPSARHDIIVVGDTAVSAGRLYVNRTADLIAILDITILPEYCCRGIGSSIVGELAAEAAATARAVQIYVETFNPSQSFFMKRDFVVEGNDGINLRMVWSPKS